MQNLNDQSLETIVPLWLKKDKEVKAILQAISKTRTELYQKLSIGSIYSRLDSLDNDTLNHLAKQWHLEVWRDFWPLELKRATLKRLIIAKPRLGTLSAIIDAVGAYGSSVFIKEWWEFEPKRKGHTFEVYVKVNEIKGLATDDVLFDLKRLINATKPVRSQYRFTIVWAGSSEIKLKQNLAVANSFRYSMEPKLFTEGVAKIDLKQQIRPVTILRQSNQINLQTFNQTKPKSTGINGNTSQSDSNKSQVNNFKFTIHL